MAGKKRKRDNASSRTNKKSKGFVRTGGYYGRYTGTTPEIKFNDQTVATDAAVASAGTIPYSSFVAIAQGTGESDRIGRKCIVKTVHLRGALKLPATATAANAAVRCRMLVVADKQCNGAQYSITDVLETANVDSFRNLSNSQRFLIFMDKTYVLNAKAGISASFGENLVPLMWNKTMRLPIEYSSTTGTLSEVRSNNLNCFLIADTDAVVLATIRIRVRFSDS